MKRERLALLAMLGLLSSCTEAPFPFSNAELYVDTESRYQMFFVSPPWQFVQEGPDENDVDHADFAIFIEGPFGILPEPIPVSGLSIFPPEEFPFSLEEVMEVRREELSSNQGIEFQGEPKVFVNNQGDDGLEHSFLENGTLFHREFFFESQEGKISRLFFISARSLDQDEFDTMVATFEFLDTE